MRYVVDLAHPLQVPCGGGGLKRRVFAVASKYLISSSRPWECGNPEGISKECGKSGKPALWLSMLSILCHFHGLPFGYLAASFCHKRIVSDFEHCTVI
jgi:hypothetical protein